jgi:hypothetical protein
MLGKIAMVCERENRVLIVIDRGLDEMLQVCCMLRELEPDRLYDGGRGHHDTIEERRRLLQSQRYLLLVVFALACSRWAIFLALMSGMV